MSKKISNFVKQSYDDLYNEKILIRIDEENMQHIHFIFLGVDDTEYEGGVYYGLVELSDDHPHNPPNQYMLSPTGRFVYAEHYPPSGDYAICTTQTQFHKSDSYCDWSPEAKLSNYLIGFTNMMYAEHNESIGSIKTSSREKMKVAKNSKNYLLRHKKFKEVFPDVYDALLNDKEIFKVSIVKQSLSKKSGKSLQSKMKDLGLDSDDDFEPKKSSKKKESSEEESSEEDEVKKSSSKKSSQKKKQIDSDSDSDSDSDTKKKKKSSKKY